MPDPSNFPVFYDPKHQRWSRFKRIILILVAILGVIFCVLLASVVSVPNLPGMSLLAVNTQSALARIATPRPNATPFPTTTLSANREKNYQEALTKLKTYIATPRKASTPTLYPARKKGEVRGTPTPRKPVQPIITWTPTPLATRITQLNPGTVQPVTQPTSTFQPPTPGPQPHTEVIGFYVNWDDNSLTSLKENLNRMDKVIPEWLHLINADGNLVDDNPDQEAQVLSLVREQRPELAVVPLVNNFNPQTQNWESAALASLLDDPTARARAIQNLLDFVQNNHLAGISIDFEELPADHQPALETFMNELYTRFHPLDLEVSQSIPIQDTNYNCRNLANSSDYLILMAYDEHTSDSLPGPAASQAWFSSALRSRLAEAPANKYVVSVGSYGYDWAGSEASAENLTYQEVIQKARKYNSAVSLDPTSLNLTFSYSDAGIQHQVWYLDAVTLFNQLVEAQRYGLRGFGLWRLGSEDPGVWQDFEQRNQLDQAAAAGLERMGYGYGIDYEGSGEILKVEATPSTGERRVGYDAQSGLITGEQIITYPSSYIVSRWGGQDKKKIALTFDDGPDPVYTSQILDILKQYQAPATFFIVGVNGDLHSDVLQRIVAEGHEIGSHTFTHPDVSAITPEQFQLELNATERLFESRLGLHTVLFRPPYGEDVEPDTPDQVKPLLLTSELGYYTIGMKIDPKDWSNPGTDQIITATLSQAAAGLGNVVLMHDSGGDRSQTVAALPKIIEGLRAQGFELVPVSALIGLTHDQVMPPLPKSNLALAVANLNALAFQLIGNIHWVISTLFLLGIVLGIARMVLIGILAVFEWQGSRRKSYPPGYLPLVSVIVPAYNEEKVICNTVRSLLRSTYPNLDIVVVDDGSSDGTYSRVVQEFRGNPQVRVFTKPNGGKAQALNFGLQQTQAEVIVAQDADTIILPEAVANLVRHLADPQVGAAAGNAKVGNRINILTKWQALEYITSQNLDRRAFAVLNCITVVPGAIGAWRRALLLEAGGFDNDTLAEDADLTMKILRMGYRIDYEEQAIALTEAPDTIAGFVKQRFRWMYGTLQAAWKHRGVIFRPRYGALGMFAIPNIFIFQILFPLISPVMDLLLIGSVVGFGWQRYQHPADFSIDPLRRVLLYYLLFLLVDFLSAFVAFLLERKEDWRLLAWLFFQRFLYRQLMYYVAIKAALTAIRGRIAGWGKLERKATVTPT